MDTSPHTPEEIRRWTLHRRPHEREPFPEVGERVLLREADFGPARAAIVTDVMDLSSPHNHWHRHGGLEAELGPGIPDVHVWRHDGRQWTFTDDPWPWVQAAVITGEDEQGSPVLAAPRWCKEARVRGSAGWMREGSRAHTGTYEDRG